LLSSLPTIKSSKPSPLTSPALEIEWEYSSYGLDDLIVGAYSADPSGKRSAGKSYVVFGKKDNTNAIELSAITTGTSISTEMVG
jgi:hypothetical protein